MYLWLSDGNNQKIVEIFYFTRSHKHQIAYLNEKLDAILSQAMH